MVSMHYIVDLEKVATGYVVAPDTDEDAAVAATKWADAAAEGAASALSKLFEGDLIPDADDEEDEGPRDREGNL